MKSFESRKRAPGKACEYFVFRYQANVARGPRNLIFNTDDARVMQYEHLFRLFGNGLYRVEGRDRRRWVVFAKTISVSENGSASRVKPRKRASARAVPAAVHGLAIEEFVPAAPSPSLPDAVQLTNESRWIGLPEAARRTGKVGQAVVYHAKLGRIRRKKVAGYYRYNLADIERLMAYGVSKKHGVMWPVRRKQRQRLTRSAVTAVTPNTDVPEGLRAKVAALSPGTSFFNELARLVDHETIDARMLLQIFGKEIQKLLP